MFFLCNMWYHYIVKILIICLQTPCQYSKHITDIYKTLVVCVSSRQCSGCNFPLGLCQLMLLRFSWPWIHTSACLCSEVTLAKASIQFSKFHLNKKMISK